MATEVLIEHDHQVLRVSCECCGNVRDFTFEEGVHKAKTILVSVGDVFEIDPSEEPRNYLEVVHIVK